MSTIPISQIVNGTPGVLAAGGLGVVLNGLMLTSNTVVPIGTVMGFSTQANVASYFGAASAEAAISSNYFLGYNNSLTTPGLLYFVQYPQVAVSGYVRGGNISGIPLATIQTYAGTLSLTVDGASYTTASINLSAANSFTAVAADIQSAIVTAGATGVTCAYNSTLGGITITSGTTGATSAIGFPSGTLATELLLTQSGGAVQSPGAVAAVPATNMAAIVALTSNFATFSTVFQPTTAQLLAFAAWTNSTANRFMFCAPDNNILATESGQTTTAAYEIIQAGYSGTELIYDPTNPQALAAFQMGSVASLKFTAPKGRATMAFRSQSGITPGVTNASVATQLLANGYNYYGAYAEANTTFQFFYNGSLTGPFLWVDSYVCQIWLNSQLRVSLATLLLNVGSIPFNQPGYDLISAAFQSPVQAALNFGMIQDGVALSASQIAQINYQAGTASAATAVQNIGYYLQVTDPGATIRQARGSPQIGFWYADGESVQLISFNSTDVL